MQRQRSEGHLAPAVCR